MFPRQSIGELLVSALHRLRMDGKEAIAKRLLDPISQLLVVVSLRICLKLTEAIGDERSVVLQRLGVNRKEAVGKLLVLGPEVFSDPFDEGLIRGPAPWPRPIPPAPHAG